MKHLIPVALALLLCGCGISNARLISPGEYEITAHGNLFQSDESLRATIAKRAGRLCGEQGYQLLGVGGKSISTTTTYHQGTPIQASGKSISDVARCGASHE